MFEGIDWSVFFQSKRIKSLIFNNKDIKQFISVVQKQTYQDLCYPVEVDKLEKNDLVQLKELIPLNSHLPVFEEKEAWLNLIAYIEKNFEKIESQRTILKDNKRL